MEKISELTPEQEARIPEYLAYGLKHGRSTAPINHKLSEGHMQQLCKDHKLTPSAFITWGKGPLEGCIKAAALDKLADEVSTKKEFLAKAQSVADNATLENVDPQRLSEQRNKACHGQFDMSWVAFFAYLIEVLGAYSEVPIDALKGVTENCGWFWPTELFCVMTEHPEVLKFDDEDRFHSDDGPACYYGDGLAVHALQGVHVPPEWVTGNPPTAAEILQWSDIEQRRVGMEMAGWGAIAAELGAKTLDVDNDPMIGTLMVMDLPEQKNVKVLKGLCGTGREFHMLAAEGATTAMEAQIIMTKHTEEDLRDPTFIRT